VKVHAHGLGLDAPAGWEVRIRRRDADPAAPAARPRPVLHAATIPLPDERGDFGSNVTPGLSPEDLFVALFEYEPSAAGTRLFAGKGRPRPRADDFRPDQLQRTIAGQSGVQYFYGESGRAFCLYAVLGSHARRVPLVGRLNAVLDTLQVDPGEHA
jgi:hypothetical protein